MSTSLKAQLAELTELAPSVHATTDRVNSLVAQMEKVLVEDMAIGLAAETRAFEEKILASKARVTEHLCLGSIGNQEQIHVIERTWTKDGGLVAEERIPWSSCERGTRLKAIAVLPDLVANLVADAKELMQEANLTASKVAGWINGELVTDEPVAASTPAPTPPRHQSNGRHTSPPRRRTKK